VAHAIRVMQVRGAPLIGATAAYGVALGLADDAGDARLAQVSKLLAATRPTAVNLHWALARMQRVLQKSAPATRRDLAWNEARAIATKTKSPMPQSEARHCRCCAQSGMAMTRSGS
jgi:methylthioribose-1-phosphate isomerase